MLDPGGRYEVGGGGDVDMPKAPRSSHAAPDTPQIFAPDAALRLSSSSFGCSVVRVIFGLVVVCGALVGGELFVRLLGAPVPGSVVGLVGLVVALRLRWVDRERLRPATELLVRRMGLFFVPAGVLAVTRNGRALLASIGTISIASLLSFVVVLVVVGRVATRERAGE